jgi:murein hydrolase activator
MDKSVSNMKRRLLIILLSSLMGAISSVSYVAYANNKDRLSSIRQSIAVQEKKLAQQRVERAALNKELQKQETSIANLLESIQSIDNALNKIDQQITQLNGQISDLEKDQTKQRKILANQLTHAFLLGRNSGMELIFEAKENERNERIIQYFGYINRFRQQKINQLKAIELELVDRKQQVELKRREQQALQDKQKQEKASLVSNRQIRKKTLAALEASMQIGQQKLDELRENEAKLQAQLDQARRNARRKSEQESQQAEEIRSRQKQSNYKPTGSEKALMARVSGIGKPQNKLRWPLVGKVVHQFGEALQGELYWKGLVISAKEGTTVSAIASGRVILANWLQGYGFLVAIDHGKGDMSLYGYNQRVLVKVDDNVKTGQAIALVGSSGGQGKPALYFEIRRDGKALNPQAWLKQ